MFVGTLPAGGESLLELLVDNGATKDFYMAGGTAASLRLGHRLSYDLDFFSVKEFNTGLMVQKLSSIGRFELSGEAWCTVSGILNDIRVSFMAYKYPLLYPTKEFRGVKVADLRDIALMKITAISGRGSKRDFIDLYAICKEIMSIGDLLELFKEKYKDTKYSMYHIVKSLGYFEDAEMETDPIILADITWSEVKNYFAREQQELFRLGLP